MIPYTLFINLKLLGKIQKNDRLKKSKNGIVSIENGFLCHFKRFIRSDSRKQTIQEITSILKEVEEVIDVCKITEDLVILKTELERVKIGIENLKFTYCSDDSTSTKLEICIVHINSLISKIGDIHSKYF